MKTRLVASLFALVLLGSVACNTDPNVAKKKYVERGNKYFDRAKYKEAGIMYRNALRKDARYGEAYYRMALLEVKVQRYGDAARDFQRTIELQPGNLDAYNKLVNIYLNAYLSDKRRPKEYITELKQLNDKLAKLHPESFEYMRLSGYLALADNKPKDAINFFEKANNIKPLEPDLVLIYLQTLAADGRKEDSERLGKEMLKKDPKVGSIYDALFLEYVRANRNEEAEGMLKQKIQNIPTVGNYLQLASYYHYTKRRDEMLATLQKITSDTKSFPNGNLEVGDFFLRAKELDLALKEFQTGAEHHPKEKATYQKRTIEVLVMQDRKQEATNVLNDILKENPKDDEAMAIRASLLLVNGNRDQIQNAINDLQTVVSRMPENPVVRYNLGRAQMAKGNSQQAKIQFEEALKLRPDYLLPRIALAQIMQQQGDFGKVVQAAGEILNYDPQNLQAKLLRTRALIGMGEAKQARTELTTIVAQNPNVWEARLQVAALDLAEKNYKAAEDTFRAMYTQTKDSRALMGLTETYVTQGQFDNAIKILKEEVAKAPDRSDYYVAMGNIAVRAKYYDQAIADYQKALDKFPRSADVWIRMGETQRLKGDIEASKASFTKAKDLAPTNITPYLELALIYDAAGQRDLARPMYEQILKIQPDHPVALNNLAYMLAESGADLDQALTMAQRAKQKMPQDTNVADTLGWIYIKKNLAESAIGIFSELVRTEPGKSTYHYHLAMALAQKGDKVAAKKELEIALKDKPAKEEEEKIRALMSKMG
jgi:tetratricopeptide (TPR) repeat protein